MDLGIFLQLHQHISSESKGHMEDNQRLLRDQVEVMLESPLFSTESEMSLSTTTRFSYC